MQLLKSFGGTDEIQQTYHFASHEHYEFEDILEKGTPLIDLMIKVTIIVNIIKIVITEANPIKF